ncbi:MAG: hypothetical protein VW257_06110, partial [Quisquiliibacterium sp.]
MSDPQVQEAIRQIRERLDADPGLIERGRLVDTTMILAVGEDEWRFRIVEGRITALDAGPFVTPSYAFRIWAPREEWLRFTRTIGSGGGSTGGMAGFGAGSEDRPLGERVVQAVAD